MLLDYFGDEFLREYDEVEFLTSEEEPRTLAEIVAAEQEFFDRVWYVRNVVRADEEVADLPDDVREEKFQGKLAAFAHVEEKCGAGGTLETHRPRA